MCGFVNMNTMPSEKKKSIGSPASGVTGSYEQPDVVAGVRTCNSSDHHYFLTAELSLFCSPYLLLFLFLQQGLSM